MLMGKTPKKNKLLVLIILLGLIFTSLYYLCFLKDFAIIKILIIIIISSSSLFVSFTMMILSTLFLLLKLTKKKPLSIQNNTTTLIEYNEAKEENNSKCGMKNEENKIARISENAKEESEVLELEDFPSDSEVSSEEQSADFELKWKHVPTKNVPIFDSYFSESDEDDEDNLIEINLPWRDDPGPKNLIHFWDDELNLNDHKRFVEVLEDLNDEFNIEEDNLIEIDISMGSIKCPRFEYERSKVNNRV